MFKKAAGDWTEYRNLPSSLTFDFHRINDDVAKPPHW